MPVPVWKSADKQIRKEILTPGEDTKTPTKGSMVQLTIENITLNGVSMTSESNIIPDQFNSYILDGTNEKCIIIGESCNFLDQRIEEAIQIMTIKEKSMVRVLHSNDPIDFLIGAPATIRFEVTLNKFDSHKPIWEWTPEEKYETALKYKEIGVRLFKEDRPVHAFHKFSKACKILITMEPIPDLELEKSLEKDINNLRLILYNNMASCQLKRANYEHTVTLCTKVINKDEDNVKALYRRGVAYGVLKNVESAVSDLKRVLTLEPQNLAAKEKYTMYNTKVQQAHQESVNMVKRMFKTLP